MGNRPAFKSVQVHLLGRKFPLRVTPESEAFALEVAELVDNSLRAAQLAAPKQTDLTYAVLGALRLGEELLEARREMAALKDKLRNLQAEVASTTAEVDERLAEALGEKAVGQR